MASPPSYPYSAASPPKSTSQPFPKKRPSLGPPASSSLNPKRRKPSSVFGPSHLRQTSFPPDNAPSFSPSAVGTPRYSRSPSMETGSLINGTTPSLVSVPTAGGRAKKRGRKGSEDADTRSLASGDARSQRGKMAGANAGKAAANDDADAEQVDDEAPDQLLEGMVAGGAVDDAAVKAEEERQGLLIESLSPTEYERWERVRRAGLDKNSLKRLINQTLSQSVPDSVVTTVRGYTKAFIGELVTMAVDVSLEELAARTERPVGVDAKGKTIFEPIGEDETLKQRIAVEHRGALTPAHLREALNRYKKGVMGGGAGFEGLSMEGRENVAPRMGGKRKLFR